MRIWRTARGSNPRTILTNLTKSEVSNVSFAQSSLILASTYGTILALENDIINDLFFHQLYMF